MCLSPETRVLTRDLLWKPASSLEAGDILWRFDHDTVLPFGQSRGSSSRGQNRARRTELVPVESVENRTCPAFALSTETGRQVIAGERHAFLGYSGAQDLRWRTLKSLSRPYNGNEAPALASWLTPWQPLADFDAGWLSGMFDGEGHVSVRQGKTRSLVLSLSQRQGPVLEKAKEILLRAGFSPGGSCFYGRNHDVTNLQIVGRLHEKIRALGLFRPIRLMNKLVNSDCDFEMWLRPDPIVSIDAIGETELIEVSTSTRTFFAEGFATRCCDE